MLYLVVKETTKIVLDSPFVVGQYVLVTAASAGGEAASLICVNLGARFDPNVYLV